jgi:regulator of sirC expression with transglutaminase-like and TPR domain
MGAPTRSARQLFAEEVRRPDPAIDLARAALLIAKEEYPQISIEQYVARLDQLAEEVTGRLGEESAPLMALHELLHVVYARHGFRGNTNAYYDPRNSFFNDVLDRRLGIPLTLGFVLLEVGWRLGLPLEGVSFPDHFLVRFRGDVLDLLIDPFDGGKLRFQDQAQELLDRVYGGRVKMQESFLRQASRRDMLVRMLLNLRGVYVNVGDAERARWVGERLELLRGDGKEGAE